jgi:hypothetical protein
MADKRIRDDDSVTGRADEDLRGVGSDIEDDEEFDDTDDELDEEEDEESTTF